ncbi:MAG: hypothetical protein EOP19_00765 [Hyphomicrobiales bacterium]|nr:MAG: hypothetical protein EOP19_00765 [Hyphomicrobiales bacterium]
MHEGSPSIPEAARRPLSPEARLISQLRRGGSAAAERLAGLPNVACVTAGIKRTAGELTGRPALIAYVTQKQDMPGDQSIPRRLDAGAAGRLATDVVELHGLPRTLTARAGDIVWAGDGDMGTACLTFIKSNRGYVATNAHVVANVRQGRIFPPHQMQPAGHPARLRLGPVAYLSGFIPGQNVTEDLAFVETAAASVTHLGLVGEPAGIARIDSFISNLAAEYWYSANGMHVRCRRPEPTIGSIPIPILADGMWFPYSGFWKLEVTAGMVAPGHSGAVVCRGSGNDISACGILFGGVLPDTAYAFQLQPRFRRAYDTLPA